MSNPWKLVDGWDRTPPEGKVINGVHYVGYVEIPDSWKDPMLRCIRHATGRVVDSEGKRPVGTPHDYQVVMFTDGTGIAALLQPAGQYSEFTTWGESLEWYIYLPEGAAS